MAKTDTTADCKDLQTMIACVNEMTSPLASMHQGMKVMCQFINDMTRIEALGNLGECMEFTMDALDTRLTEVENVYAKMFDIGDRRELAANKAGAS